MRRLCRARPPSLGQSRLSCLFASAGYSRSAGRFYWEEFINRQLHPMVNGVAMVCQLWRAMNDGRNAPLRKRIDEQRDWDINIDGVAHYGMLRISCRMYATSESPLSNCSRCSIRRRTTFGCGSSLFGPALPSRIDDGCGSSKVSMVPARPYRRSQPSGPTQGPRMAKPSGHTRST